MRAVVVALLFALAGCPADEAAEGPTAAEATPTVPVDASGLPDPLADDAYAWCHEAEADADQAARWCRLLDDAPPEVCPGLRATCDNGVFEATGCQRGQGGTGSGAGGMGGAPGTPEDPWRPGQGCDADAPSLGCGGGELMTLLGELLRWVVALAVAALVVVLIRQLLLRMGWIAPPAREVRVAAVDVVEDVIEGDDDLPAWSEDRLLQAAHEALAAGRLGEAVVFARGAALRRLARQERLTLHRARTDREYLRAVEADREVHAGLTDILRAVEDHRWAGRILSHDTATRALDAAGRLLAMLLLAWALLVPTDALAARRHAPNGDAALWELLDEAGWVRVEDATWLRDVDDTVDVVVVDLYGVRPTPEDWDALKVWTRQGGILVLGGPPPKGDEAFELLGRHDLFSVVDDGVLELGSLDGDRVPVPVWPGGPTYAYCDAVLPLVGVPDDAERLQSEAFSDCPRAAPIAAMPMRDGWVVGIADPMLLRNGALMVPENRTFLLGWLEAGEPLWGPAPDAPRVLLATVSAGDGPQSPAGALSNARLLPFVLQLGVTWALAAFAFGWPLRRLRDGDEARRLAFAEHAEALGRHWEVVGDRRHAAAALAGLLLDRHGARGLAGLLVARGMAPAAARDLVGRAEALVDGRTTSGDGDVATVEALWTTLHPTT